MHFQPSLPRLPIPKLEKTCQRYLNAQKPLLTQEQMQRTEVYVAQFLKGEGGTLQEKLVQNNSRNRHTSYISEPWFDMYLRDRKPLPINYNPILIFTPESDSRYDQQLVKATNLLISSIRFMKSLRAGILEPEVYHLNPKKSDTKLFRTVTGLLPPIVSWYGAYFFKAFPLDMSQYSNLFNSTRVPKLEKDTICQDTSARHVLVLRKGHFYAFDVLDENGRIHKPLEIATNLNAILEDNGPVSKYPLGVLTTSERNQWATTRCHLSEIGNQNLLKKIDSAIFVLILEDDTFDNDYNKMIRMFLHGDGTNRWFDKSFSLIVAKDGTAGINFEHSWGDGVAVLRYFNDVKKDISEKPKFHPEDVSCLSHKTSTNKLEFTLDSKIQNAVDEARQKYKKWTNSLDVNHLIYTGFGKKECKKFNVSPDAMMQLAFQLAYYKQQGRMVATYESCSTAAFKYGRTETIRPCTNETKAFCEALSRQSSKTFSIELKKMIVDCSNTHNILTKEAAMGQGFDRHLFCLKKTWEELGTSKMPAIFEDPAYGALNHNILSSSTLSSPSVLAGSFGPVVDDGYGIGYRIKDRELGAVVTSYQGHCNGADYVSCLEFALKDIYKVLLSK